MTITTYSELQDAVAGWIDRDDLTARIAEFIALAEAEFNRTIFTPDSEVQATLTASAPTNALPAAFRQLRSLYIDSDPRVVPEQTSLSELRWRHSAQATGQICSYAIQGGDTIVWGPAPDGSYDIPIVYWEQIPALSDSNPTNWLLDDHPDIYLYGALVRAEALMVNDARIAVWGQMLASAMNQLLEAGLDKTWGAVPQRLRSAIVV